MAEKNDKAPAANVAETTPDSPDVADTGTDPAEVPGPAPDTPDVPDVSDVPEPEPEIAAAPGAPADVPADPPVDKARAARKPRTLAQKEKRKADDARRKAAIAEAPRPEPSKEQTAEADRKAALQEELAAVQADIEEAEGIIRGAKERCSELLKEIYPSLGKSDRHVDAVRGYIKSEKELRANRALAPARLKAMLEAAGKAPIDAAFSVQRARGMARPVRAAPPPAKDNGEGAAAASQE
ncbi:MAG: hypothetical protein KAI80_08005 [Hyphomicrobiaceae bacterium]|nr:hypothetical protein [Hyphomicrobiaceae bacterium]